MAFSRMNSDVHSERVAKEVMRVFDSQRAESRQIP